LATSAILDPAPLPTVGNRETGSQEMTGGSSSGSGRGDDAPDWLTAVARDAAAEAAVPVSLLGEYLQILAEAATRGRRPSPQQLAALRRLGGRAAEQGVDADRAVDLYLSAAWRLWRAMPVPAAQTTGDVRTAAETVLRVIDEAVETLVDGHQAARRQMIRHEESARREFVDDLLRGDADVARLVERAEPFGLDLGRPHQVLLAEAPTATNILDRVAAPMERAVVDRFGDREVLVATKDAFLAMIVPGEPAAGGSLEHPTAVRFVHEQLRRRAGNTPWQVAAGRPYPGAYGVARSYEEAREALALARRLHRNASTVLPRDLLLFRVLGRDQAALFDLVHGLLEPLTQARGGAEPLQRTLEAYFATGGVATETARRLHVSVRTVTYRLAKIRALTGLDATDPGNRLALHVATLGARLIDWPAADRPRDTAE
jgi:sugar diacid utilization regulator